MDDFDYSIQVSERDWNTFYQECEECDLQTPVLASLDDSGISDADDASPSASSRDPHKETDLLELDFPDDGPPDCTGCPLDCYLSTCDLPGPKDVLPCSEEDTHLESMNKFFERFIEENVKDPAEPVHLPQAKSQTDSNQMLTGKETEKTPRGLSRLRDSALMDTSNAGDSGYSSHLADSKPDHSSGDILIISDFEEECPLSHNASVKSSLESHDTKKQGQRSFGSSSSRGVLWESEPDPINQGLDTNMNETPILYSGDAICPLSNSDKDQQGFRRMCKNISVQNLRALEAEPRVTQVMNASLHTIATEEEEIDESSSTFLWTEENVNSVPLKSKSNVETIAGPSVSRDEFTKSYGISFRKIFEYLFGGGEAAVGLADVVHTEVPMDDGGSVPETYDYFFSEFETGNFFFPLIRGSGNKQCEPAPIFSCSRPFNRSLQFPEAYDYFFPDDSPVESENKEDTDPDHGLVRAVTCIDKGTGEPAGAAAAPDMYEHFFAESNWGENIFWRNPFSLRRVRFTGLSGSRGGPASCVLVTPNQRGRSLHSTIRTDSTVNTHGTVSPQSPLYCLEEQILRELAEQQRQYTDLQKAVAIPNAPILSVKQSDMCLICIAVASWVLKTGNPQDVDTWKAALLAYISALSAIRYLRHHARNEP
ncbi:hypothetical protein AAFF_G00036530 [Aldrovandia affinis]|uniref:PGC-1 and ERR-induced regulator in muscle protein 1 n=1 Tax=Aldrovandia affinis TaxID=143900 RepID=A0AAD7S3N6_9TELE|nr:hypothetical protein AAFF_G00036530 [Aldrovandia affinis]